MMLSPLQARVVRALAAFVGVLLSGCTNMSGLDGTAEYGCKAPQGVQCDSVSGNYYNAIQNNLPSQRQSRSPNTESDKGRSTRSAPTSDARPLRLLPIAQAATDSTATSTTVVALPLRSQARVLRLWFKPWEDVDHDLYDQGFVYVQIDNGRWLVDHTQQRIRDAYAPLRPPRPVAASASAQTSNNASPKPAYPGFLARPAENSPSPFRGLADTDEVPTVDIP
jgi:conjugal transfer pilus assembly protein TraV